MRNFLATHADEITQLERARVLREAGLGGADADAHVDLLEFLYSTGWSAKSWDLGEAADINALIEEVQREPQRLLRFGALVHLAAPGLHTL